MIFEDTFKLIEDQKILHVKILDSQGKRIYDIEEVSPTNVIDRLKEMKSVLSTYGKVNFKLATDAIYKQNWKSCFEWPVTFGGIAVNPNPINNGIGFNIPEGYIPAQQALLLGELNSLKAKYDLEMRLKEMEYKISDANKPQGMEKYLPMLGMILDIDPTKMQNVMTLASMQSAMYGGAMPSSQINGMERKGNTVELKGTEEEKKLMQSITDEMDKLSNKVELQNIDKVLKALNNDPKLMDMAIMIAKQSETKTA